MAWRVAAAVAVGALALAGCRVQPVTPAVETVASDETPDAETSPTETPDAETPDEQEEADTNAGGGNDTGGNDTGGNAEPRPIAFGMPGFPSGPDRTEGAIRERLLKECGTPTLCVEIVTVHESSDEVDEGDIIRVEPPEGTRMREGDTVTIVRSSGPADTQHTEDGNGNNEDPDDGEGNADPGAAGTPEEPGSGENGDPTESGSGS